MKIAIFYFCIATFTANPSETNRQFYILYKYILLESVKKWFRFVQKADPPPQKLPHTLSALGLLIVGFTFTFTYWYSYPVKKSHHWLRNMNNGRHSPVTLILINNVKTIEAKQLPQAAKKRKNILSTKF